MTSKEPFLEKDYQERMRAQKKTGIFDPILDIKIGSKTIPAYADTGSDTAIFLSKSYVEERKLDLGKKIEMPEPLRIYVADGHQISGDVYEVKVEINGQRLLVEVVVVDPERFFRRKKKQKIVAIDPLLGRDILDKFDALFKGKKRKIALFYPE